MRYIEYITYIIQAWFVYGDFILYGYLQLQNVSCRFFSLCGASAQPTRPNALAAA